MKWINAIFTRRPLKNNSIYSLLLLSIIIFLCINWESATKNIQSRFLNVAVLCSEEFLLNRIILPTAQGPKSYNELLDLVYKPFGYEYDKIEKENCTQKSMLFPLRYKNIQCQNVFDDWLNVQIQSNITAETQSAPPREIKESEKDRYLLNGLMQLKPRYINEIPARLPKHLLTPWTEETISKYIDRYNKSRLETLPYGEEAVAVYNALKTFKPTGLKGMVIGSQTLWIEAMALFNGAAKVVTAEYAPLSIQHPKLEYVHPIHLVKNWKQYSDLDFVVSFSSIEHSGLGRYGDPPDPIGDFRELSKIYCLLKPGSLLYIGVPTGVDTVVYNAHRIYGSIRWPMMAAGFEFVGAFYKRNIITGDQLPSVFSYDNFVQYRQYMFVLRKK